MMELLWLPECVSYTQCCLIWLRNRSAGDGDIENSQEPEETELVGCNPARHGKIM